MARDLASDSLEKLLRRARDPADADGFARAMSALVDLNKIAGYRRAMRLCRGNRALADEVFQESFVRLFTWLGQHREALTSEDFPRLLSAFVSRTAIDAMRRERHQTPTASDVEARLVRADDKEPAWLARQDADRLLGLLDARSRTVIELTYLEELSANEIAERMGLSASNVRILRHRALRFLRDAAAGKEAM